MKWMQWLAVGVLLGGTAWGQSPGWIVLPAGEYETLRSHAFPTVRVTEPPAIDQTLTRVDYELNVSGDFASGRANLTVDVLKSGWVRVPIPANLLVRQARLEGKLLTLAPAGGQLSAVLSKRGRAVLALDVVVPVVSTAGEERVTLPASSSGVTRASLTQARAGMEIKIAGGVLAEKNDSNDGSKWLAYARSNEPLAFIWHRKTEDHRTTLPLRFRGSLTQLVGLGEDATSVYAEVGAEVVQGAARQLRIQLPSTVTVNQVLGATVGDWEAKDGVLDVSFLEPVETSTHFVVAGETRLPRDGAIEIPMLRLLDAERESGGAAVEVMGAGEIKDVQSKGLDSADAAELGQLVASRQSPSLVAFRYLAGVGSVARSLKLNVVRYTQQAMLTANADEARYRVLQAVDGKTLIEARYAVRNNQRNFLKVTLPQGAVVWSASVAGKPVRPGQAPDGGVLLPLIKAPAGEEAAPFAVEVLYLVRGAAWTDRARATEALPALDLAVSKTGVVLYYPPGYRVTAEPGAFRAQSYERPSSTALGGDAGAAGNVVVSKPQAAQNDILQQFNSNAAQAASQALVDRFRAKSEARTGTKAAPGALTFPALGASLYLVSELTSENQAPAIVVNYQKERRGGVR